MPLATIPIVDDEPTKLFPRSRLLRSHHPVRAANSGESPLRAAPSEPRPNLPRLDVMIAGPYVDIPARAAPLHDIGKYFTNVTGILSCNVMHTAQKETGRMDELFQEARI